jgi:hypothetical protein
VQQGLNRKSRSTNPITVELILAGYFSFGNDEREKTSENFFG